MIRNILIFKNMKCLVNWSNATETLSELLVGYISTIMDIATIILNEQLIEIRLEHTTILLASYERITITIIHNHENKIGNGFNKLFDTLFRAFQVHYSEYLDLPVINIGFFQSFNQVIEEIVMGMNLENVRLQINGAGS